MRLALLLSNGLAAIVFVAGFVLTFTARGYIEDRARAFTVAKTVEFATPLIDDAEQLLEARVLQKFLSDDIKAGIRAEFIEFRVEPEQYTRRLVANTEIRKSLPLPSRFSETLYRWKEMIRGYYNSVLGRLFLDLRIFSGSNIVAACIAFAIAFRSRGKMSASLKLVSALLLLAVLFGSVLYLDDLSFFTMLFNSYLGWYYPVLLAFIFTYCWWAARPVRALTEASDALTRQA